MFLSPATLVAVSHSLRVFDDTETRLDDDDVKHVLSLIAQSEHFTNKSLLLTMSVQSLILSGRSRDAAMAILTRLSAPNISPLNTADSTLVSKSLDVALFETYRNAQSLDFSPIFNLEKAKINLNELSEQISTYPDARSTGTLANFTQLTKQVSCTLLPLLNSEHQGDVVDLLYVYLHCVEKIGVWQVDASTLLNILRRCIRTPRLTYDLEKLTKLRQTARHIAELRVRLLPTFAPQESVGARLSAYKFLSLSDDTEKQSQILKNFHNEALKTSSESATQFAIDCACWTQETTTINSLLIAVQEIFSSTKNISNTPKFLSMCMRFGDERRGLQWIAAMNKKPATLTTRFLEAQFLRSIGESARSLQLAARPLSVYSKAFVTVENTSIQDIGFERVSSHLAPVEADVLYGIVRVAQEAVFQQEIVAYSENCRTLSLDTNKQPLETPTTLIIAPNHLPFVAQLPVAAIELARTDGAEVVCMVKGLYPSCTNLTPSAALLQDALIAPYYFLKENPTHAISGNWTIDPAQKIYMYEGINYYAGIHNSLGIIFRRFNLDFEDELVAAQVDRHLIMFQSIHDLFMSFASSSEPSRSYRFVVIGVQYGIGYALRNLVTALGKSNFSLVHASNGYEAFDSQWQPDDNSDSFLASYHSVRDLTNRPETPLGFRPTPADCKKTLSSDESFYFENKVTADYVEKIDNRERAAAAHKGKVAFPKRRVLLLGTILPDLSIPQDSGFVHEDIKDWVNHTIEISDLSDSVTLVVKQHPSELDHKIGFYVAERFVDLLPNQRRNVEILPYETPFHDAVSDCDLVVLWSGTSSLELSLIRKPYVACSRYAQEEYPLYADEPASRSDYEAMILGQSPVTVRADARLRAVDIIYRTSTSPVREFSRWPKRQLLNAQVWPVKMDPSAAKDLLADAATRRLANRLLTKN